MIKISSLLLLCGYVILSSCTGRGGGRLTDSIALEMPLTIDASTVGRFSGGESWRLHVSPSREAKLMIGNWDQVDREFVVAEESIAQFKDALLSEGFFDLEDHYGQSVPDGSVRTLTVSWGEITHTVEVEFLMNWLKSEPSKLVDPARALRVFDMLRGWFDDSWAVDLRRYNAMVVESADKHVQHL